MLVRSSSPCVVLCCVSEKEWFIHCVMRVVNHSLANVHVLIIGHKVNEREYNLPKTNPRCNVFEDRCVMLLDSTAPRNLSNIPFR